MSRSASRRIRAGSKNPRLAIRFRSTRKRFSATVMSNTHPEAWRSSGMTATPARAMAPGRLGPTGAPSTSTVPASTASRLDSRSVRGVWPLPSTPATPTISWLNTSRLRSSRATSPSGPRAVTPRRRSTGVRPSASPPASLSAPSPSSSSPPASSPIRPRADASERSDTSRPTMARARMGASASAVAIRSTTFPVRMMVTSSVACRISSSLWLTRATARFSSCTAWRSTSNSRSDSAGVSTEVGSSKTRMLGSRRRHLMISTRWRTPAVRSPTRASASTPSP